MLEIDLATRTAARTSDYTDWLRRLVIGRLYRKQLRTLACVFVTATSDRPSITGCLYAIAVRRERLIPQTRLDQRQNRRTLTMSDFLHVRFQF